MILMESPLLKTRLFRYEPEDILSFLWAALRGNARKSTAFERDDTRKTSGDLQSH
jgi:hypothetical protein